MFKRWIAIALIVLAWTPVQALSDPSSDEKIQTLKKEIAELKSKQQVLKSTLEDNKSFTESLQSLFDEGQEKLTTNGFASAYFVKSNKDVDIEGTTFNGSMGIGDTWSLRPDLIIGVQYNYQVNERTEVVLQLSGEGNNDMDIEASWAYLRYELAPDLHIRAGRLRIPFYLYSESIDVGYTYPWVRPPVELYITDFTSFEGMDIQWNFLTGNWANTLQMAYASLDKDGTKIDNIFGLYWFSQKDDWTIRVGWSHNDKVSSDVVDSLSQFLTEAEPDAIDYLSIGGRYDNGTWLVIAEISAFYIQDKLPYHGQTNGVVTIGRRWDKWMPYIVLAKGDSSKAQEKNHRRQNIPSGFSKTTYKQQSVGLGFRYDINEALVLKTEYVYYSNLEDGGNFDVTNDLGAFEVEKLEELGDSASIFSIGFDVLF